MRPAAGLHTPWGVTRIEQLRREGIRRLGSPQRGFRYVRADGRPAPKEVAERVKQLRIPPAWTDVAICASPRAELQAVGRDKAGRWQYRYHDRYRQQANTAKYARILGFGERLPRMRRRVNADLRKRGLPRDRVLAAILRILGTCYIRPGSQVYADTNGSFGLATLRPRHVRVAGDTVHFDFPGKSGQRQRHHLKDARVASVVRQCLKVKGKDVFKFLTDDGAVVDVRRRHINEYIQEVMGPDYTAKDFRTWAGTLVCACALARAHQRAANPREAKRAVVEAVKEAASRLGNTPAVARDAYIYPQVLQHFEAGRVVEATVSCADELKAHDGEGLHRSERALLQLLKDEAPAGAA